MDIGTGRVFRDVSLEDLGQIRRYVREMAAAGGCESEAVEELIVAVNEGLSNIVRHGYGNVPGDIGVAVVCEEDVAQVTLLDECVGFDPTGVASPDTTLPLAERPFGGVGVHMMRAFCDELSYRRDKDGGNVLVLVKRVGG